MANAKTKHSQRIQDPNARKLRGEKIFYVPTGAVTICPTCKKQQRKGMLLRFEEKFYCSERCVPAA